MKIHPFPDTLRGNWIVPDRPLPLSAGVNDTRVRAMQIEIEAGRYAPNSHEVADGVLSAIVPARRH